MPCRLRSSPDRGSPAVSGSSVEQSLTPSTWLIVTRQMSWHGAMNIAVRYHDSAGEGGGTPGEPDLESLSEALQLAASIEEPTERLLEITAIIGQSLRDLRVEPVVVGGLAVAYWSDAAFLTADIDVVMVRPTQLEARLGALGLVKQGREWVLPGHELAFEIPAAALEQGDEAVRITLPSGRPVHILSLEDALLWRLREWIHWQSPAGFRQASFLLVAENLDNARLDERAAQEGLARALEVLRQTTAEIEDGRRYESWELAETAKNLDRRS